jgi:hypothetical protein
MVKLTISAPLAILAYANSVHGVFSSTLFSGPDCLPSATCQLQIGPHTTNYDPPVGVSALAPTSSFALSVEQPIASA